MKVHYILILFLFFIIPTSIFCQGSYIKNNATSLCILKLNYFSYQFEGGSLAYYALCEDTSKTLPFQITRGNWDINYVLFRLKPTLDTIFYAGVFFAGNGNIHYPENFTNDTPFNFTRLKVPKPKDVYYYDFYYNKTEKNTLKEESDSIWNAVSNLEIVHQFQKVGFKAEIYHYTPSQPGSKNSKWIIFLYHSGGNAPATQIVEQKTLTDNISLYPNPTNADIQTLSFLTDKVEEVQIDLYDMSGRRIMKVFEGKSMVGNNKHSVDLTNIASGVYLYKIYIGKQTAHIKTIKP